MALAKLRKAAKLLLPPILFEGLRSVFSKGWEYVGPDWPPADRRAEGWLDPSICRVIEENWSAFSRTVQSSDCLGSWPWAANARDLLAHNAIMIFGYALGRAAKNGVISVLDWGGLCGHYALIAQALWPEITVNYSVKDLPPFAQLAERLMPGICFTSQDEEFAGRKFDLVFASSSLQYSSDWRSTASLLARATNRLLLVTQVRVVHRVGCYVEVQHPQHVGFRSDYISWVFNHHDLVSFIESQGLTLEREFLCWDTEYHKGVPEHPVGMGFLFRAEPPSET
jgi:putative methyltransferase (TIGR04325 family)